MGRRAPRNLQITGRRNGGRIQALQQPGDSSKSRTCRDVMYSAKGRLIARPRLIRWALTAAVASWTFLVPFAAGVEEIHGPLAIRNQSPIQILFFQFVPERAVPLGHRQVRLRLDIAETNTLAAGVGREGLQGRLDLEMTYANLQARIGLGKEWELGIDLPIIVTHGGFMDGRTWRWGSPWRRPWSGGVCTGISMGPSRSGAGSRAAA